MEIDYGSLCETVWQLEVISEVHPDTPNSRENIDESFKMKILAMKYKL